MQLKQGKWAIILLVIVLYCATVVYAAITTTVPSGPTVMRNGTASRRAADAAMIKKAYAGNVTNINLVGITVTQTWQGYYGNVSGKITLDDSSGNTMYEWNLTSPEGEVYATTASSISWANGNIRCYNYSLGSGSGYVTLTTLETSLGLASDSVDGVSETFVNTTGGAGTYMHDSFYVGDNFIKGDDTKACPRVYLFNENETNRHGTGAAATQRQFQEVLLYATASNSLIYTSILDEEDLKGFNDRPWDFEMLVGEDGHRGNTSTTNYYFYVELE